jgi:uncharacterized protein (DUF952 family)
MPHIYHITNLQNWDSSKDDELYTAPSLNDEGLIHCCLDEQVADILDRYYKDATDIVVLTIDTGKLRSQLVYEWSPSLEATFPHIYGPINRDSVIGVKQITAERD